MHHENLPRNEELARVAMIAKDGLGVIAVFGGHIIVISEHRIRLKLVVSSSSGTRFSRPIDIGAVRVESEPVESSQTSMNAEWGCSVICAESEGSGKLEIPPGWWLRGCSGTRNPVTNSELLKESPNAKFGS